MDKEQFTNEVTSLEDVFRIESYCVGIAGTGLNVYLRYLEPVNKDVPLSLVKTVFPSVEPKLKMLQTGTVRKNFLNNLYTRDAYPKQTLILSDYLSVSFENILPSWLAKYDSQLLDLQDPLLEKYPQYYAYLSARIMNNYVRVNPDIL